MLHFLFVLIIFCCLRHKVQIQALHGVVNSFWKTEDRLVNEVSHISRCLARLANIILGSDFYNLLVVK